eukprot:1123146-Pleurochrysis_carterae.AAC.2
MHHAVVVWYLESHDGAPQLSRARVRSHAERRRDGEQQCVQFGPAHVARGGGRDAPPRLEKGVDVCLFERARGVGLVVLALRKVFENDRHEEVEHYQRDEDDKRGEVDNGQLGAAVAGLVRAVRRLHAARVHHQVPLLARHDAAKRQHRHRPVLK